MGSGKETELIMEAIDTEKVSIWGRILHQD